MSFTKPQAGTAGSVEHFNFIERTDRRNLHTQLKSLVSLAKEIATKDLNVRREKLRKLLESEDKNFEEEFANSAKARLQSEIEMRAAKKQDESKKLNEFLKKKHIQQCINSCYEVREAFRQREREEVRICQEEQILENERKVARQRELDKYWLRVQNTNAEREDARQKNEECLKQLRQEEINYVLRLQLEERDARLAEERKEKAAEVERINNLLRELKMEEINRDMNDRAKDALQYREELLCMMAAKQKARLDEEAQQRAERQKLMSDVTAEEAEARRQLQLTKEQHKKTLLDYIEYVRRMRQLEADAEKMREDRIEDLRRVDICTKGNIEMITKKKAEAAAKVYAELRRQICADYERRKLEEIERREDKIIENRFARLEAPHSALLEQRRKNREELDRQIEEIKRVRAEEEESYQRKLLMAADDPDACRLLAIEYLRDDVDYLEPHPNWLILMNPCKQYVAKGAAAATKPKFNIDTDALLSRPMREPILPQVVCTPAKPKGPCTKVPCGGGGGGEGDLKDKGNKKTCTELCGCAKRWHQAC